MQFRAISIPVALAGAQSPKDIETVDKIVNDQLAAIEELGEIKNIVKLTEARMAVFYEPSTTTSTTSDGE